MRLRLFSQSSLFGLAAAAALATGVQAQPAQLAPPAVLVEPAALRSLNRQLDFIGRVQAIEKVELRARVQGFLGPFGFREGDAVKTGQILFEIEQAPYLAALHQQEARLAGARATFENADQQLQRAKELVRTNAVSQAQVDQRVADQTRANADVLAGEASVEDARIKLSYTQIKSPIDGRIGRAAVTPGNLVGPDTGVLATVVRDDSVRVLFPISQREILEARKRGLTADIAVGLRLGDGSRYAQTGKIDLLDVVVDARTDAQMVRATFANPDKLLTEGQTVRVTIEQQGAGETVTAPMSAVATDQSGAYVLVVGKGNVVEQRRVKLGLQRDGFVTIEDGVKATELVIVQGQQRARPGQPVAPQRAPTAAN